MPGYKSRQDPEKVVDIATAHANAQIGETQLGSRRLLIDPLENLLVGSPVICKYLGIRSITTMIEWHEVYGLPVMKRADGQWMTTMTAIDDWIWLASEAEVRNRPFARTDNKRADLALKKAQRRVDRMKAQELELQAKEAKKAEQS